MYVLRLNTARIGNLNATSRYLESKEDDRLQTAIVALSFLSTDNVMCAQAIHDEGCMKLLVPHLNAPIQGMRGAVASTLRNMYVLGPEAKDEFLKLGGLNRLVEQLKLFALLAAKLTFSLESGRRKVNQSSVHALCGRHSHW